MCVFVCAFVCALAQNASAKRERNLGEIWADVSDDVVVVVGIGLCERRGASDECGGEVCAQVSSASQPPRPSSSSSSVLAAADVDSRQRSDEHKDCSACSKLLARVHC